MSSAKNINRPPHDRTRFDQVFEYIEQHLDKPLSVEHLAEVAHFSKYHFHRQFAALTGLGVFKYLQLLRLRKAGYQLSFRRQMRYVIFIYRLNNLAQVQ